MVCLNRPYHFKFWKAVFHRFYLVHYRIHCYICPYAYVLLSTTLFVILLTFKWCQWWYYVCLSACSSFVYLSASVSLTLLLQWVIWMWNDQKQSFRGVLKKRCYENIQQIYRRTPMPKCDLATLLKSDFGMGVLL